MNRLSWAHRILLCLCTGVMPALVGHHHAYASGDGMRCGSRIISAGDTQYDVRSLCGVPDATAQRVEYRTLRRVVSGPCFKQQGQLVCGQVEERTVEVVLDEWTYDFGSTRFIRTLTFEQGKLRDVVTGRYGRK